MESVNRETASLLCDRLAKSHPEWINNLRVDESAELPVVVLSLPHCPGHELSIEVQRTEATVAYSDGLPPGPAERLFVCATDTAEEGLDAVCEWIASLVRGEIILVRERLSRLVRFIRRQDCESLLWFVDGDEFKHWSLRRRRRVLRAWSWDGTPRLAI